MRIAETVFISARLIMISLSYSRIFCLESQKIDGTYQRYNYYFKSFNLNFTFFYLKFDFSLLKIEI